MIDLQFLNKTFPNQGNKSYEKELETPNEIIKSKLYPHFENSLFQNNENQKKHKTWEKNNSPTLVNSALALSSAWNTISNNPSLIYRALDTSSWSIENFNIIKSVWSDIFLIDTNDASIILTKIVNITAEHHSEAVNIISHLDIGADLTEGALTLGASFLASKGIKYLFRSINKNKESTLKKLKKENDHIKKLKFLIKECAPPHLIQNQLRIMKEDGSSTHLFLTSYKKIAL